MNQKMRKRSCQSREETIEEELFGDAEGKNEERVDNTSHTARHRGEVPAEEDKLQLVSQTTTEVQGRVLRSEQVRQEKDPN